MKTTIISVRDIVANTFSIPTFHQSRGSALRAFSTEVNRADENNQIYKYPGDFELYCLGFYDDEHGSFEPLSSPEKLGDARDYVIAK